MFYESQRQTITVTRKHDNTMTTQPRTLTYVTTQDLNLQGVEAREIADALDITYGDGSELTIINSNRFQDGAEDALGLTRAAVIRDKLLALKVNYVAFIG